jgi:hypothetical protein
MKHHCCPRPARLTSLAPPALHPTGTRTNPLPGAISPAPIDRRLGTAQGAAARHGRKPPKRFFFSKRASRGLSSAQMTPGITEFSRVSYKRKQSATVSSYAFLRPYANSEETFAFAPRFPPSFSQSDEPVFNCFLRRFLFFLASLIFLAEVDTGTCLVCGGGGTCRHVSQPVASSSKLPHMP